MKETEENNKATLMRCRELIVAIQRECLGQLLHDSFPEVWYNYLRNLPLEGFQQIINIVNKDTHFNEYIEFRDSVFNPEASPQPLPTTEERMSEWATRILALLPDTEYICEGVDVKAYCREELDHYFSGEEPRTPFPISEAYEALRALLLKPLMSKLVSKAFADWFTSNSDSPWTHWEYLPMLIELCQKMSYEELSGHFFEEPLEVRLEDEEEGEEEGEV